MRMRISRFLCFQILWEFVLGLDAEADDDDE
jgi:hypothetical protein